jgi:hypothetical protein
MSRNILLVFNIFLLFSTLSNAQSYTQTVRGKVIDVDTRQPLIGANVLLLGADKGTATDTLGRYRLEQAPAGRYRLQVSYIGYDTLIVPEVLVESGKEVVLDLELSESSTQLGEVVVRASRSDLRTYSPTVRTLTIEETLRFPATFFDPARLATNSAGVVNDNDQTNGMSIRGNSPNGMVWRLEGVDIVNPNHTPNAGTFSDRVTRNGGGVNILSAQLLGTSYFFTGAFPVEYGNALAGVMDMRLRKGNDEQHEFTGQIGLIGIDLSTEGPFSKQSRASYLVNYRYSTVGLITSLGVDFGDEEISFEDLAFNLVFPTRSGGQITLFGMGGRSKNIFEAERDSSVWEFQKDRYDITFRARMGAAGATYTQPIGRSGVWRTTLAASILDSDRTGDRLDDSFIGTRVEEDVYDQRKLSLHSVYSYKVSAASRFRLGVMATQEDYDILSVLDNRDTVAVGDGGGLLLQPYLGWQSRLAGNLNFNAGLQYLYFDFNGTGSLEPRLSVQWDASSRHSLSLSYGLHSQLLAPQLYFARLEGPDNSSLELMKAHHVVMGYIFKLDKTAELRAEAFYQSLFDVPVSRNSAGSFSALNLMEGFVAEELASDGAGRNYGLEVSLQKYFSGQWYYLANATWYESEYQGSDGIWRDTRFNGNYLFNLTGGKEWSRQNRRGRYKILGINSRLAYIGGFRATPIDAEASRSAGETVYITEQAFTLKQDDYFRIDLRIYYKTNKPGFSSTLSLDIQNLTNRQNAAFSYYDAQKNQTVVKTQLGIIPILNYRVEF